MNLAQLRNKFLAILNRNDCTTDLANDFISMAQTRLERTLRVPGMENMSVTTGADPSVAPTNAIVIPSDFLSLKYLYAGETLMENKDLGHFLKIQQDPGFSNCTHPRYYSRVGASFLIKPTLALGDTATMVYYAAQPQLLVDTDTNFFSNVAADLLIYGALSYATDYFVDDRVQAFESRFTQLYADIEEQGRMTDMEQSSMAISPAYSMEY
ncbi:phage adaptor protein [Burkholderia sp. DN3021]|uniref:phage adaptor protein n=1 Tax=Burkholderia sp. DN3021 TaxID=3410137 RepID=UPI003C7A743B